jgi:hypothetical protein
MDPDPPRWLALIMCVTRLGVVSQRLLIAESPFVLVLCRLQDKLSF